MTHCPGITDAALDVSLSPRELAQALYDGLRTHCCDLEELIERSPEAFSAKELKRLDKAVTVMKVGFKTMKKVVRKTAVAQPLRLVATPSLREG